MNTIKFNLLMCTVLINFSLSAKCIKDIFVTGVSLDSIAYNGSFNSNEKATLASDYAYGLKAAWIIYCPKTKKEFLPYIRLRNYHFNEADVSSSWSGLPSSVNLFSIGMEGRKTKNFGKQTIEFTYDFELREELGFGITTFGSTLSREDYINLKAQVGLRYFAWKHKGKALTMMGKIGPLVPVSGGIDPGIGILYGVSGEFYLKLAKKTSLRLDLYYDSYKQSFGELTMNRIELGLRANIVFRI